MISDTPDRTEMVTAPSESARVRTVEFLELLGYTLLGDQVKAAVGVHTTTQIQQRCTGCEAPRYRKRKKHHSPVS